MTNKQKLQNAVTKLGLEIGGYNLLLDELSLKELNKVIGNLEYESDTDITIKRKKYVVELDIVDNEIDLNVLTKAEYINRYGDERYDSL